MKTYLKLALPPVIFKAAKTLQNRLRGDDTLFDGDDRLFKKTVKDAKVYAEYGCGSSTIWVAKNCEARIFSVDTSKDWVQHVKRKLLKNSIQIEITDVDVGELGEWGRPVNYSKRSDFSNYTTSIWNYNQKPDVVLIDGRFRVSCFLTTLIHAEPGTKVFFDDYTTRPHYHVVEEFIKIHDVCGRQALFIVPQDHEQSKSLLIKEAQKFSYVLD